MLLNVAVSAAQNPTLSWAKCMGGTLSDFSSSIAVDAAGNVYTTGGFKGTVDFDPNAGMLNLVSTTPTYTDIFISKLDAAGNLIWAIAIGDTAIEEGISIAVDKWENIFVAGFYKGTVDFDPGPGVFNLSSNNNGYDFFICKLDSTGNFMWAAGIGGTSDDYAFAIAVDSSGNAYTTGYYEGTVDFDPGPLAFNLTSGIFADAYILKLDSAGNLVWAGSLGGLAIEHGRSLAVDNTGNVYTMGDFQNTADFDPGPAIYNLTAAGVSDIFISKLDANGNFVWAKTMGGSDYEEGGAMAIDADANIYSTGTFQGIADFDPGAAIFSLTSSSNSQDIFISKLDSAGNFLWSKSIGSALSDKGYDIAVAPSGLVYTTGFFFDTVDFDPGPGVTSLTSVSADIFISKLDAGGNFQWAISMGGAYADEGNGIATDLSGNVYTTGEYLDSTDFDPGAATALFISNGYHDIFIQKLAQSESAVPENELTSSIKAYPNPSTGNTRLDCNKEILHGTISIYNVFGQLVYHKENLSGHHFTVDLKEQLSGIYYISISDNKEINACKIVMQH